MNDHSPLLEDLVFSAYCSAGDEDLASCTCIHRATTIYQDTFLRYTAEHVLCPSCATPHLDP
jgi:hypothetical protein